MKGISVDPNICHGKPRIAGTRIMVSQVLDLLEHDKTPEQILSAYFPDLTVNDVRACARFDKLSRSRPPVDQEALRKAYAGCEEEELMLAECGIDEQATLLREEDEA